jgi:hypothetical protein
MRCYRFLYLRGISTGDFQEALAASLMSLGFLRVLWKM